MCAPITVRFRPIVSYRDDGILFRVDVGRFLALQKPLVLKILVGHEVGLGGVDPALDLLALLARLLLLGELAVLNQGVLILIEGAEGAGLVRLHHLLFRALGVLLDPDPLGFRIVGEHDL